MSSKWQCIVLILIRKWSASDVIIRHLSTPRQRRNEQPVTQTQVAADPRRFGRRRFSNYLIGLRRFDIRPYDPYSLVLSTTACRYQNVRVPPAWSHLNTSGWFIDSDTRTRLVGGIQRLGCADSTVVQHDVRHRSSAVFPSRQNKTLTWLKCDTCT